MPRPTLSLRSSVIRVEKATEPLPEQPQAPITASPQWALQAKYDELLKRFPVLAEYRPLAIGIKSTLLELTNAGELGLTPAEL